MKKREQANELKSMTKKKKNQAQKPRPLAPALIRLPQSIPDTPLPSEFKTSVFGLLDERLQHAIVAVGYSTPTPIQLQAIPPLLKGRDLLGCAQTGTGKTAAFLLPILHHLLANPQPRMPHRPRALILSPTRELAAQTGQNCDHYIRFSPLVKTVIFGGVSQIPQIRAMLAGSEVLVATPGRLLDLISQKVISLEDVTFFVLDEADRMLDMGFLPDMRRIIALLPNQRQTMFFSATLSPEIRRLANDLVHNPVEITITPEAPAAELIRQSIVKVEKSDKDQALVRILETHPEFTRVIVFAKMRHAADRIARKLSKAKIEAAVIHSDKTQAARIRALSAFKNGSIRVLVATDIASRGIDVENVTQVINVNLPEEAESYIHRIGRTARAGASGAAISFLSQDERHLLAPIEKLLKKPIPYDRALAELLSNGNAAQTPNKHQQHRGKR